MEFADYLRFLAGFIFILSLIGLCAWSAKRFGLAARLQGVRGPDARLSVVETLSIDMKHKLLLIRRDGKEHLIMVGADRDLLVEANIDAPAVHNQTPGHAGGEGQQAAAQMRRVVDFLKERRAQ